MRAAQIALTALLAVSLPAFGPTSRRSKPIPGSAAFARAKLVSRPRLTPLRNATRVMWRTGVFRDRLAEKRNFSDKAGHPNAPHVDRGISGWATIRAGMMTTIIWTNPGSTAILPADSGLRTGGDWRAAGLTASGSITGIGALRLRMWRLRRLELGSRRHRDL